ncbi:MAG: hypothetical protein K2P92_01370, partial [Bdellovibrionaceae bacterium]|nr:hypothetical protein [Pseudobdellovibrionaceae bacterium]
RKNGTFEKTMATVQSFVDYRKARENEGRGFVLFGSMCVQKDNWHEIGLFLDFCKAHGLNPILQSIIGSGQLSLQELQSLDFNRILDILNPYLETDQRYTVLPVYQEIQRLKQSV